MTDRFLGTLGICRKAGKCILGYTKTEESVKANKVFAIFIASDISPKTEKELRYLTRDKEISVVKTHYSMFEISNRVGMKTGIVAIEDDGFATALIEKYKGEITNDD